MVPVISVYGRSGSGKSTIIKFVCKNLSDFIEHSFVNLRKSKTIFGCSNLILSELGHENLKSAQGLNKAVDCIEDTITKILESKKKIFVLVLDEYDVIFSDTRGKPSDFFYKLLTMVENLREKGLYLCIVTISNNALSDYELDDRVKSRMGNAEIFFEAYSQKDVLRILQNRASKAFSFKIDSEVLEYCSQLSSDDHGDARRALELLRTAGDLCDGKKISLNDITNASNHLQKDRVKTILSNITIHQHILIVAICTITAIKNSPWNATSEIFNHYNKKAKSISTPLSYRRISDLLIELQNYGLLESKTSSKGKYGFGKEYKLKISPDIIGPLLSEDWWNHLLYQKKLLEAKKEWKRNYQKLLHTNVFSQRKSKLLKNLPNCM